MFLVYVPWEPLCRAADQGSQASKTIVDLQPFRQTGSIPIKSARGEEGRATLINLNPDINDWYLLQLNWGNRAPAEAYHLEIANRRNQRLMLDDK